MKYYVTVDMLQSGAKLAQVSYHLTESLLPLSLQLPISSEASVVYFEFSCLIVVDILKRK